MLGLPTEEMRALIGALACVIGVCVTWWAVLGDRARRRRRCPRCWRDCTRFTGHRRCPHCYKWIRQDQHLYQARRRWWFAIFSLVLVVASLVGTPWMSMISRATDAAHPILRASSEPAPPRSAPPVALQVVEPHVELTIVPAAFNGAVIVPEAPNAAPEAAVPPHKTGLADHVRRVKLLMLDGQPRGLVLRFDNEVRGLIERMRVTAVFEIVHAGEVLATARGSLTLSAARADGEFTYGFALVGELDRLLQDAANDRQWLLRMRADEPEAGRAAGARPYWTGEETLPLDWAAVVGEAKSR